MVAIPAHEKLSCKQGTQHASTWPSPDDHVFSLSNSWPWQLQEEPPQYPNIHSSSAKGVAAPAQGSVSPLTTSVADHCYKQQLPYSLSTRAGYSAAASTSRSAISSIYTTSASASPTSDSSHSHAYRKDPAPEQELPPLDPCDHMKTLLTQLASCISSLSTAYAHQQAAMHSHNAVQLAATDGAEDGSGASTKAGVISTTDKAMVEELESLSRLHSQLALLPRRLPFNESGAPKGGAARPDRKEADELANTSLQLRRYEDIIARFHDEIRRKEAVVEALKETLAKSMLKGEKLQRRVQALEAKRLTRH